MQLFADLKSVFLHCGNRSMFVHVMSSGFAFKSSHNFAVISAFHHVILVV
jgi:hypothetical protein